MSIRSRLLEWASTPEPSPTKPGEFAFEIQAKLASGVVAPTIFDVGAHHGQTAKRYRALFPGSTVWAFEPFAPSFAKLSEVARSDPRIHPRKVALGDRSGPSQLRSNIFDPTNSILPTAPTAASEWRTPYFETKEIVPIQMDTLDNVVADEKIKHIDILKIDTQGSEHLVLEGARETIARRAIDVIYTEIIAMPTYEGQSGLGEMISLVESLGYGLFNLFDLCWGDSCRLQQLDAIFVRRLDWPAA